VRIQVEELGIDLKEGFLIAPVTGWEPIVVGEWWAQVQTDTPDEATLFRGASNSGEVTFHARFLTKQLRELEGDVLIHGEPRPFQEPTYGLIRLIGQGDLCGMDNRAWQRLDFDDGSAE
jgi:hypothetical protein